VTALVALGGWGAVSSPVPGVAPARPAPKPVTVASTQTLVDAARQRTLVTTFTFVRAAHRAGPLPLLVFLHGYDQTPADYHALLTAWASAGYLVAAPTFPRTSHAAAAGLDASDYANEPADVRFVIDETLAESAAPTGTLAGRVDATRVGVAGHSLGAEVVLGLLNRCCRDPRLRAAVSLAGSEQFNPGVPAFPLAGYFVDGHVPLLLVHGDADTENPYDRSVTAFAGATPPKFFESLHGAGHRTPYQASPADDATARVVTRTTVDFLDVYLKGDPRALPRLARDGSVRDVASLQAVPS
jgi:dienelactone hydrolase